MEELTIDLKREFVRYLAREKDDIDYDYKNKELTLKC